MSAIPDTLARLLPHIGGHRFLLAPMSNTPNHLPSLVQNTNGELDVYWNDKVNQVIVINAGDLREEDGVLYRAHEKPELGKDHIPADELIENLSGDNIARLEISTLEEWLDAVDAFESEHVTIELKGSSVAKVIFLAEQVDDLIYTNPISASRVAVESFCVEAMAAIVERFKRDEEDETRYATGLLWASKADYIVMDMHKPAIDDVADMGSEETTPWWLKGLIQAKGMGLDFISVHFTLVTDEFLAVAKRLGLEVCAWVVGDIDKARELVDKGVYVLTESADVYGTIATE